MTRAEVSSEWKGFLFFFFCFFFARYRSGLTSHYLPYRSPQYIFHFLAFVSHQSSFMIALSHFCVLLLLFYFFPTYLLFLLCYGFDHRWALSARRYSMGLWPVLVYIILSGVIEIRQGLARLVYPEQKWP